MGGCCGWAVMPTALYACLGALPVWESRGLIGVLCRWTSRGNHEALYLQLSVVQTWDSAHMELEQWKREVQCSAHLAELLAPYTSGELNDDQFREKASPCMHMPPCCVHGSVMAEMMVVTPTWRWSHAHTSYRITYPACQNTYTCAGQQAWGRALHNGHGGHTAAVHRLCVQAPGCMNMLRHMHTHHINMYTYIYTYTSTHTCANTTTCMAAQLALGTINVSGGVGDRMKGVESALRYTGHMMSNWGKMASASYKTYGAVTAAQATEDKTEAACTYTCAHACAWMWDLLQLSESVSGFCL